MKSVKTYAFNSDFYSLYSTSCIPFPVFILTPEF